MYTPENILNNSIALLKKDERPYYKKGVYNGGDAAILRAIKRAAILGYVDEMSEIVDELLGSNCSWKDMTKENLMNEMKKRLHLQIPTE